MDEAITTGRIGIVDRRPPGANSPLDHGFETLISTLEALGWEFVHEKHWRHFTHPPATIIIAGTVDDRTLSNALQGEPTREAEGYRQEWTTVDGTSALLVCGADPTGAMYGLLSVTEAIEAGEFDTIEARTVTPATEVRGANRFLTSPNADTWFYEDEFWESYLDRLARHRFNRFVLVTGYDSAFFSPPYPFVVEVPGFETVTVSDEVDIDRSTHRERLRDIGRRCRARGIECFLGIWQQRPWTDQQARLVEGIDLDSDSYARYCREGMRTLLESCPEIDGVQLRVNFESGVGDQTSAEAFWNDIVDAIGEASENRERTVEVNLRAKGLTDGMIDHACETGLPITVPTKFWCESTGLPYHNVQMRPQELQALENPNKARRYSYADLLKDDREYDVLYRLWTIGTNRIFLWGDPDYGRRFTAASRFGDSRGFEVTDPLSLKGGRYNIQRDWPLFSSTEDRWYEYEADRYWAWYLSFGRAGYDPSTIEDVWERAFTLEFGPAADAMSRAYRTSSKVLPLVTAAHLTAHPALQNWAELDTGGALFADHNENPIFEAHEVTYQSVGPSDPGLFYPIDTYIKDFLDDDVQGRYTPLQCRSWYRTYASDIRSALERATAQVDPADQAAAFRTTVTDFRLLADLADFHADRTTAAMELVLAEETNDERHYATAAEAARTASETWKQLAARGSELYHDDLRFGQGIDVGDGGTWADRQPELDADVERLEDLAGNSAPMEPIGSGSNINKNVPRPATRLDIPETADSTEPLSITIHCGEGHGMDELTLRYRLADQTRGAFETISMNPIGEGFQATIDSAALDPQFDLLVYATTGNAFETTVIPGLYHPDWPSPYAVVELE